MIAAGTRLMAAQFTPCQGEAPAPLLSIPLPFASVAMTLIKTDPFETEISSTLRHFVADLRDLEQSIFLVAATEPQREILHASGPAGEFLPDLQSVLTEHIAKLDAVIGVREAALPKSRPNSLPSFPAPSSDKGAARDACELLGCYCAQINLAALSYTMLHARSVALRDVVTAKMALTHLQELVPFLHRMCAAAPRLAVEELSRHFGGLIPGAAETAVRNTHDAGSQYELGGSVH